MTNWSVLVIVLNRCTLAFLTVWYCFQHHSKHWIQTCFKCQETEKFISAALSRATGGFQTRYLLTVLNPSVSWDFSKLQTAVWVYTRSCTTNKNPIRLIWTLKRNAFRQKRPLGELKRVDYRRCFLFRFQHFCTSWLPTFFKRWSRGIYSFLSSIWRIWNKWLQRLDVIVHLYCRHWIWTLIIFEKLPKLFALRTNFVREYNQHYDIILAYRRAAKTNMPLANETRSPALH